MAKVILEYNKDTGEISDGNGTVIMTWHGLKPVATKADVSDICELKKAGFSAEDIVLLEARGVV